MTSSVLLRRRSLPVLLVGLLLTGWITLALSRLPERSPAAVAAHGVWPAQGQAAFALTGQVARHTADQRAVPIASVAKVMTAYLVLRHLPLAADVDRPLLTVSGDDRASTVRAAARNESTIAVVDGERLTERQALQALLIPSANNVARMLAVAVAGSDSAFVDEMNSTASRLGMRHTRYTDPSGYDAATVSTATDQLILFARAMRDPVFALIAGMQQVSLPVAGTVHNTDTLLGKAGFVGGKTGSDDAAGGCLAFRAVRIVDGRTVVVTGVVLGQRRGGFVAAALAASRGLVDRIVASVSADD